jgi:hypothetical protein
MKNLRKFMTFRYVNITIFVILFQFATAHAGFMNSQEEILNIKHVYDSFYRVSLNGIPIAMLNKDKILNSLKGIDYTNLKSFKIINLFDKNRPSFSLEDLAKAHLDVTSIFPIVHLGILLFSQDLSNLFLINGYFVFKALPLLFTLKESLNVILIVSIASGVNPFLGMVAERFVLRSNNFNVILDDKINIVISDSKFEKYVNSIISHLEEQTF